MGSQPIRIQLGKILQENLVGKSCGKIVAENLAGKILQEILVGKSCRKWRRGKSQFKKGSDWWKFSIWNRVDGEPTNQDPAWENLAGKSCGKLLWEILWENLVGNSCGKSCRKSCGKILQEILQEILVGNLVGKSCGKFLWEIVVGNLAGKSCGKFLWEILQEILWENLAGNLAGKSCGKILWEIFVGKHRHLQILAHFLPFFRPLTGNKTSLNYFSLVEEVLSFDMVGHM